MIKVLQYEVVNGEKSEPVSFEKIVKDNNELEELRKHIEELEKCWVENRTITGIERKKVKDILFTYQTS